MRAPSRFGMLLRPTLLPATLALALTSAIPSLTAQTITGTIQAVEHPSYAGIASNFLLTDARAGGKPIYDGEMLIFCSDLAATSFDENMVSYPHALTEANSPFVLGSLEDLDVWNRYSTVQDEGVAIAMLQWFVDHHYETSFLNGDETSQYAFQNVVWEIFGDGGTANGLNFNGGNIKRSKFNAYGSNPSPELWRVMNALLDSVGSSGVTSAYVPQNRLLAIHDVRPGYQDYLGLASTPSLMQIPEPSTALLAGFALLAGCGRRNRPRKR